MPPNRWQQISQVYHAALTREESERTAFVREACAGDEALRREVESLLAQVSGAAGFLSTPAVEMAGSLLSDSQPTMLPTADGPHGAPNDASRLEPGQRFGPYRIERLLGRGGMGEVYEAEHLEHGRRIALKVLSQSLSDPTDRARFLREGQLAASVSHPHTVYIFGSEEIAGIPVIAMELLLGGTLKDRIEKRGPLSPIEAIDAILQIVSGLEAAHAAGILHRDIKPSNCFVDADGTIKVGDFGLSIPVLARDVTQLTTTGTFQGTPQFASPEHLRGQPLDVRSDIYAVGATLHYLLTGRPPFDDRDLMALVSRIATEPPPSLRKGRPEIPRALAATVLQCLAKDPAHRPTSYRSLASVLEPLSSSIKTPAPLGIRFAAGLMDSFFSQVLLISPAFVLLASPSPAFGARPVWENLVEVAYFAITESVWGASLGKALCGFRVVTENGARPRFARALLRALVFVAPRWFASGLALLIAGSAYSQRPSGPWIAVVADSIVAALLFAPARRANGFAGIHEWVSHTRTVLKSSGEGRRIVRPAPSPIELPASPQRVGPYVLVNAFSAQPNCGAALGYDERLRRTVWLRFPAVDSDSVPPVRRILRRPARPHWLAGQRTGELAWDAYEQVPGQPFDTLLTQVQSWGTVRGWLCDLAEEVQAGLRDGSLPVIEFDRVWIGDDGRARLLDWPVPSDRPDSADSAPPEQTVDLPQAERFLYRVAVSALEGHVLADTHPHVRTPRVPLPISATDCLAKLGKQRFGSSEEMVTALTSAARGPAAVSRTKRAAHLSLCAIPTILMLVFGLFSLYQLFALPLKDTAAPEIAELVACLNRLEVMENRGVPSTDPHYHALELYIAGRHRNLISNPPIWSASLFAQRVISSQQRALATRVAANLSFPQKADVDEAARILRPFLDNVRSDVASAHPYVLSVNDGEVADRAGVKVNDVVVTLDGEPITFVAQLGAAIRRHHE
jgi:serine/threonine protein kinase